ncbi:MAG: cysteine--tRNA ligase [Chloroflexi bacterium GWC2_73_18]|nr:MAG: cysteine--tRNA ligase [Chloroflexi bacterium GWC2_73_18]
MTLRLVDTRTGAAEPFVPLREGEVGIYSCGPTVYGPAHVGNFRSFLFADLLVRHLRFRGFTVRWVMNITDVDDKIIARAAAEGVPIGELTERYAAAFLEDARRLRMTMPDVLPRATHHIPEMVELIELLIGRGHAYRADDGSIYFRIASWPRYGTLVHIDPSQLRVGERVSADEYAKDDARDFALWKVARPGEPSWGTSLGPGRPGWHIECSAMSMRYLGPTFDLHTGGVDLVFPHHEDEIAQSEAATGKPFVRTWLHCAHLRMGGVKMAKSVGNIDCPADVYERGFSPRALRYALLAVHYRSPLEFSDESLHAATAAVERLAIVLKTLGAYRHEGPDDPTLTALLDEARADFTASLDHDLNVAAALGAVFELVRELNRRLEARCLSAADAARAATFLRGLDAVLAVAEEDAERLPPELEGLLERRVAARAARDWTESDRLRQELANAGVTVEDARDGQRWRFVEGGPRD